MYAYYLYEKNMLTVFVDFNRTNRLKHKSVQS